MNKRFVYVRKSELEPEQETVQNTTQRQYQKYQRKQLPAAISNEEDQEISIRRPPPQVDQFYEYMIKNKKRLSIQSVYELIACVKTLERKNELTPNLDINFDLISSTLKQSGKDYEKELSKILSQLSSQYQYKISYSTENGLETEGNTNQEKNLKQEKLVCQNQGFDELLRSFIVSFPTNTKQLSLKFDKKGQIQEILKKNMKAAEIKIGALKELETLLIDFTTMQLHDEDIDSVINYFQIFQSIQSLKKLKIIINSDQIFKHNLRDYFEDSQVEVTVQIRYVPQKGQGPLNNINKVFNFLKDFSKLNLQINWSEITPDQYDFKILSNQFDFYYNIKSLHFMKNTFKFQFDVKKLEILKTIIGKVLPYVSTLKLDNAFINYHNSGDEREELVRTMIEEISQHFKGKLQLSIDPNFFLKVSPILERASFKKLIISFDDTPNSESDKIECLKYLSDFTYSEKIKILIKFNFNKKYQPQLKNLITQLEKFNTRFSINLHLSSYQQISSCPEDIKKGMALSLMKSLFQFRSFEITFMSNFVNQEALEVMKNSRFQEILVLQLLALSKVDIKTEYSFKRHNLYFLWDD